MRQKPCVRWLPDLKDRRVSIDDVNDVQVATWVVGSGMEWWGLCAKCDVVHRLRGGVWSLRAESLMDRVAVGALCAEGVASVWGAALMHRWLIRAVVLRPTLPGHVRVDFTCVSGIAFVRAMSRSLANVRHVRCPNCATLVAARASGQVRSGQRPHRLPAPAPLPARRPGCGCGIRAF